MLGAKLAKYSFEKEAGPHGTFEVKLIIAEELPEMQHFVGTTFLTGGRLRTYSFSNLQSFTLTRFKAPELMGYQGRAIVIDPDIFALPGTDIGELFTLDLEEHSLAACWREKKGVWESSVMVLDCTRLKHWKLSLILTELAKQKTDQSKYMWLTDESVKLLPWGWNSMDAINADSKILHTTIRLTQPWKTGLKIDFTQKALPKIFGIIPREPLYGLLGKYPTHYLPHPDTEVVDFFFNLLKSALRDGVLSEKEIEYDIENKNVRPDIFEVLKNY